MNELSKIHRIFALVLILSGSYFISQWIINSSNLINERISFQVKISEGGPFQLFFSSNNQHSAKNSAIINTDGTDSFKSYSFTLSEKSLTHIRFDPPSDILIQSITIGNIFKSKKYIGQDLYNIIRPLHHIDKVFLKEDVVRITINGNDPYLQLVDIQAINLDSSTRHIKKLIFSILIFLSLVLAFVVSLKFLLSIRVHVFDQTNNFHIHKNLFLVLNTIVFSWFLFQMLYFALNIKRGASPDENYHIEVSKFYSEPGVFYLENTEATIRYGSLTTKPHFYYILMGKLLLLKPSSIMDYQYLRFLNIIISLLGLYLTLLLSKEITANKLIQIGILIAQSNILMFVFLSSMVSYDNLINFLAVASFIFLFRFINHPRLFYLLLLFLTMVIGSLTKVTYPPLILLELFVLLIYSKRVLLNRRQIFSEIKLPKNITVSIVIFVFLSANIILYGGNFIKYGNVIPSTVSVIGEENALKGYGIYMRNSNLRSTAHTREMMPIDEYVSKYLTRIMETTFSVIGHMKIPRGIPELRFYIILLSISLIASFFQFGSLLKDHKIYVLLFLLISYFLIVLYVNYSSYTYMRSFGVALHGRYNFPVISLFVIYLMYSILSMFSDKAKIPVILIITIFMIINSFIWFLERVDQAWFKV